MINLIVAHDDNGGIGKDNKLPWCCKDDMQWFKTVTESSIVVMGRKTFESLKGGPLMGRMNVVLSSSMEPQKYTKIIRSVDEIPNVPAIYGVNPNWRVFIIGGAQLYKEVIDRDMVDNYLITHVFGSYNCDTFLPAIPHKLKLEANQEHESCSIEVYSRDRS